MRRVGFWAIAVPIVFALISFWYWVAARPVQHFTKTSLVPAEGAPGTKIDFCIDDLEWFRICPAVTFMQIVDAGGKIYDMPTHPVSKYLKAGKIGYKCRDWGAIPNIQPGPAKVTGYVEAYCPVIGSLGTITIVNHFSKMTLIVKAP